METRNFLVSYLVLDYRITDHFLELREIIKHCSLTSLIINVWKVWIPSYQPFVLLAIDQLTVTHRLEEILQTSKIPFWWPSFETYKGRKKAFYPVPTPIGYGSIQEDRHKVEQFHFMWNSSTICGTAAQKCGTAPQNVEQFRCKQVLIPQIVKQRAELNILNFLWSL